MNVNCHEMPTQSHELAYRWGEVPACFRDDPIALLDLDGTLRGEVVPMIRLATLIAPNWRLKLNGGESLELRKLVTFCRNVLSLWKHNAQAKHHRLRYKPLFSELHVCAAATLKQVSLTDLRTTYRSAIELMSYLWSPGSIKLLRELTPSMTVVLVTGSEQLQTEECVRQLGRYGIRTDRIIVRGSLYGVDEQSRFDGSCHKLNITTEAKREAVAGLAEQHAVRMAVGNSRSDLALFEAVEFGGIRCFISPKRRKKAPIALKRRLRKAFAELGDINLDDERLERLLALQRQSSAESVLV